MGKIYRSTDKKLPKEIRRNFSQFLEHEIHRPFEFKAIHTKAFDPDEEMIVEGIANLAEPDRWGEIILPEAWNLELFKKNPIMLYEHWRENAIGIALSVDAKKDGLYYKAQIGNPKRAPLTPTQIHVRSLLAQGILRTNSVGFIPHVIEYDEDEDQLRYTDVELLEISIVAIPMQQDSVITSVKSWRSKAMTTKPAAASTAEKAAKEDEDDAKDDEQDSKIADVAKSLKENTDLTKGCHDMLTKMAGAKDKDKEDEGKTLRAEIATLKAANEALTAKVADLETKSLSLLNDLRKSGKIKAPAAPAA